MTPLRAVLIGTVVMTLVPGAVAQAATLSVNSPKRCFGTGDGIPLSGTGYTPGAAVVIARDGQPLNPSGTADGAGNINGSATVGGVRQSRDSTYTATDQANTANVGTAPPVRLSPLRVGARAAGDRGLIQRFGFRGFTSGGNTLYGHIRRAGRTRKNFRIGRLKGACKTLSTRRRIFRAGAPSGRYRLYVDTYRRYAAGRDQQPYVPFRITRRRVPSSAAAAVGRVTMASEHWTMGP